MALLRCLNCGREYTDRLDACPHCGFEVKLVKCPECGRICSIHEESCHYCGYPLLENGYYALSREEYEAALASPESAEMLCPSENDGDAASADVDRPEITDYQMNRSDEYREHGNPESSSVPKSGSNSKTALILVGIGVFVFLMIIIAIGSNGTSDTSSESDSSYTYSGKDLSGYYTPYNDSVTYPGGTLNGESPDYSRISLLISGDKIELSWYGNSYFGSIYHDSGNSYNVYWDNTPVIAKDLTYSSTTITEESAGDLKMTIEYLYKDVSVWDNVWFSK